MPIGSRCARRVAPALGGTRGASAPLARPRIGPAVSGRAGRVPSAAQRISKT
ncbi:hypothetical protein SCE1572_33640 [Sorangium cellulosum So0157-2]|uniref:Uncharacterized protein n=1 Tax=Sorangium cellulosum So0157-2 TaxID=1254432 RepID=S4Y0K2_SORCE|nr:hypothetical protein SCE1572_33640 [Sorangium cellulosum So0157-2]